MAWGTPYWTMAAPSDLEVTERSLPRRKKERVFHDRERAYAILDEALVCHVGFSDGATTWVLPTTFARVDDVVYLHGAVGNHMFRTLGAGVPACLCATLLDGIVLARSARHHSMNYRSVVLFGTARRVDDVAEKRRALDAIVDHVAPGRSADARPPTDDELRTTLVVAFPVEEGSAKVRSGGPVDDAEDMALPVWAGVVPLAVAAGVPVPDAGVPEAGVPDAGVPDAGAVALAPAYVTDFVGHRSRSYDGS